MNYGVNTQKQSSDLVVYENSTFRNLALVVSGHFMAEMGALFTFKCACDSTLVYVCQADAEKCIFVWTILSQTPRHTPQVTYDAGRISARIILLYLKERRMLRKRDYQGRLPFHFFEG